MRDIWSFLLQTLSASGAAALLLAVKAMFRDKLSPRWQFAVWGVLAVILVLPAGWRGRYVLLNWPFCVELLRSALTGQYGALARVEAPIPLPPLTAPETAADWLFVLYAAGTAFFLLRYLAAYVRLRLTLGRGRPVENTRVRAVAEEYGLPVCPVVEVEGLPSAFVCGMFRPVLALPAGVGTDDKVLLHELLHLKYGDVVWGWVIALFRCLHWCNPLLWWCADQAGNDLESLCDQRVLERLEGEDRRDYGRILLAMADEKYARAPGTSSMANGGKNIRRRIESIARFKKYPAGMELVSVCLILLLAAPMAAGARATVDSPLMDRGGAVSLSYARTVPCTTYAGAFDTYAKSVITGRSDYRAMCAPLPEQSALAERCRTAAQGHWERTGLEDIDSSYGYQIYNLSQVGEAYEGLLVLGLNNTPEGEEWDGTVHSRWLAVQPVRAEKAGDRWVVIPQRELSPVQGDVRDGGNMGLPAWEYGASAGDFDLRIRWQSTSAVDSYGEPDWLGRSDFRTTPVPDGEFTTAFDQILTADYTGLPGDKSRHQSIGAAYRPMGAKEERPHLSGPGELNGSAGNSTGEGWGQNTLDWDQEGPVFLLGGGGSWRGRIQPPACYAADLYLNGEKTAELTLLPVKGGNALD